MNKWMIFACMLISTVAAGYAGRYVGKRFLRGKIGTRSTLALLLFWLGSLVLLVSLIVVLGISVEYVLWVGVFIGSAFSIALEDPYGIHEWLEKNPDTPENRLDEKES